MTGAARNTAILKVEIRDLEAQLAEALLQVDLDAQEARKMDKWIDSAAATERALVSAQAGRKEAEQLLERYRGALERIKDEANTESPEGRIYDLARQALGSS